MILIFLYVLWWSFGIEMMRFSIRNFTRKWYPTSTLPNIYQYFTGANLIRNINKIYSVFYSYIIYVIIVPVLLKLFTSLLPTLILH